MEGGSLERTRIKTLNAKKLFLFIFSISVFVCAKADNSAIIYADQYARLPYQAIVDTVCPPVGCTIYATQPNANLDLGTLDPGTKVVTLYLGPFTYTVDTIILRSGLQIIGSNASTEWNSTNLQAKSTQPVFVLPQTNNNAVQHVYLRGFHVQSWPHNVQNIPEDAFFFDCSSTTNTGLWYSLFEDIYIQDFKGAGLHFRCRNDSYLSVNQFNTFINMTIIRAGPGNAVRIEGANGALKFINGVFDGPGKASGGTNIYVGAYGSNTFAYPFSIDFDGTTSQAADVAVNVNGCLNCRFVNSHHENVNGGYLVSNGAGNTSLLIDHSYFAPDGSYVNRGGGYLVNVTGTALNNSVVFSNNTFGGTPDHILAGPITAYTSFGNSSAVPGAGGETVGGTGFYPYTNFPYLKISTGIQNSGTGFQHKRVPGCTTSDDIGAKCKVTITWNTPFADTNYTATCNTSTGTGGAGYAMVSNRSPSTIEVYMINGTKSKPFTAKEVACIAVHD